MKMIKKISIAAFSLAALNASASMPYNKHELVKNINQVIKEVQQLGLYQAPENCKWHVKDTHSHIYKARKDIFEDDVFSLKLHLTMASKSLDDLKYEDEECEGIKVKSKKVSNMIHKVLNQIEHQES